MTKFIFLLLGCAFAMGADVTHVPFCETSSQESPGNIVLWEPQGFNCDTDGLGPLRLLNTAANPVPGDELAPPPDMKANAKALKGKPAGELEGFDQHNKPFKLTDHKGKVILLDLSTTWCKGCKEGAPDFNQYYESLKDKGLVCVTCIVGGTQKDAAKWAKDFNMTMPILAESKPKSGTKYYFPVNAIYPSFVVIDKQFNINEYVVGNIEVAKTAVKKLL